MTFAKEILESANEIHKGAMNLFRCYQNSEEKGDMEMAANYWAASERKSGKCDGLLLAYKMLTGKKIYACEIKEELERLS